VPYLDLVIAAAILVFAGKGFVKGFFVEALTFGGFFVALFVTANLYTVVAHVVATMLSLKSENIIKVVVFVLLFVLTTFFFSLVGQMLTKATQKLNLSGLNRFFGFVFGAAKGAFVCGILLAVALEHYPQWAATIKASVIAPKLALFANKLLDLLKAG
jgi:membrane protein required for colicin V production